MTVFHCAWLLKVNKRLFPIEKSRSIGTLLQKPQNPRHHLLGFFQRSFLQSTMFSTIDLMIIFSASLSLDLVVIGLYLLAEGFIEG